ncbi:MAG TPA: (5-formylfuran-3-yl)methyl phosphate synthase [Methylophilus sp.]
MIKLLISVKNAQEAKLAIVAGADLIDLKDPAVGALGNLDDEISRDIIQAVDGQAVISATVGEGHEDSMQLLAAIDAKFNMGVDIVKLSITPLFEDAYFLSELKKRIATHQVKLVAVMFADAPLDLNWIAKLANIGFYGAMLDTAHKNNNLLLCLAEMTIRQFVNLCEAQQMQAGLAGSLRVEYVPRLVDYLPSYVGFRSGVCEHHIRQNHLLPESVRKIKDQLHKHNNVNFMVESVT